jgi:hypothetical protein
MFGLAISVNGVGYNLSGIEVMYSTAFGSIIALILFIEADIEELCKYEPDTPGSLPLIAFGTSSRGPNGQLNILLRRNAKKYTFLAWLYQIQLLST